MHNLNDKLVAYNFLSDSGLGHTASKAGFTALPIFGQFSTSNPISSIVGMVVAALLSLLGVFFLILIIYGGIIWMTAEGDESKVEKAQGILRSAIIGLIITLSAYAISYFVVSILAQTK